MSDTRKTIRSFQCRDALWERFEEMAGELECSVDYLINDSMKQYARQRGYGATRGVAGPPPPARASLQPPPGLPSSAPTGAPPPPAPPLPPTAPKARSRVAPPPPPVQSSTVHSPIPPPPPRAAPKAAPRVAPPPVAPPPVPRAAPPPAPVAKPRALVAYYDGQRFPITKDRFIIGRGRQSTDLTIKDPNVSRQHCMVEFLNNRYYMVDMGSTNGVEYGGKRVQRHAINEGDVFRVCDHELRFSFA